MCQLFLILARGVGAVRSRRAESSRGRVCVSFDFYNSFFNEIFLIGISGVEIKNSILNCIIIKPSDVFSAANSTRLRKCFIRFDQRYGLHN